MQNGNIERFNERLRDECLNYHWFETLHRDRQMAARLQRSQAAQQHRAPPTGPLRRAVSPACRRCCPAPHPGKQRESVTYNPNS